MITGYVTLPNTVFGVTIGVYPFLLTLIDPESGYRLRTLFHEAVHVGERIVGMRLPTDRAADATHNALVRHLAREGVDFMLEGTQMGALVKQDLIALRKALSPADAALPWS